ncbi:DapH/DapD/GlmU-related protein [Azohydromonas lata]|uniref:DapH/DapD/GlmU-related protein n=1 Tax=Azohydromonas lata TaxID=45677 RepID=UPI0009FC7779|nr:DapH/DapD/GlmU-related protein [Azohydromonas lata]
MKGNSGRGISGTYGIVQSLWLLMCLIHTRIFFGKARLVRLPIFLRGRRQIYFGAGFTCGYLVRLDAFGAPGCIYFGRNVQLNDFVHIGALEKVHIGDNVLIASRVFITDHGHGNYAEDVENSDPGQAPDIRTLHAQPVTIEDNVWIGENVCILPGSHIGKGCVIGAGAVVKGVIPPYSIAVGAPAVVVKRFDQALGRWVRVPRP